MDPFELKSQGCGTLMDVNKCPSDEVIRHWEFDLHVEPPRDLYDPADVERLNRICAACDKYEPRKA